jgi:uncharacterized Fe-S radical SAM superfamily protein PflX
VEDIKVMLTNVSFCKESCLVNRAVNVVTHGFAKVAVKEVTEKI